MSGGPSYSLDLGREPLSPPGRAAGSHRSMQASAGRSAGEPPLGAVLGLLHGKGGWMEWVQGLSGADSSGF